MAHTIGRDDCSRRTKGQGRKVSVALRRAATYIPRRMRDLANVAVNGGAIERLVVDHAGQR